MVEFVPLPVSLGQLHVFVPPPLVSVAPTLVSVAPPLVSVAPPLVFVSSLPPKKALYNLEDRCWP